MASTMNSAVEEGWRIAHSIGEGSKVERGFDAFVQRSTEVPENGVIGFVNNFYEANRELIDGVGIGIASLTGDGKALEQTIGSFAESAKAMIQGLDALASIHPAVGVAVVAFKLVVTLDMTRRENNRKVLVLKIGMKDMMAVLFELRHVKDPLEVGPDGQTVGGRMQNLIQKIADDIKNAGSACDAYMKKGFLAKTVKAKIYEGRLAEYAALFEAHKVDLERALSMHTARAVDAANEKLDEQSKRLGGMEGKIDQVLELFKKLDTPREKDVLKFLEENGGAKAVIEKDDLLTKLVAKGGETLSSVAGSGRESRNELSDARKVLSKELDESVDAVFKKNLAIFERKLEMQANQLKSAIRAEGDHIIHALSAGAHDRILDPDLQELWKEMGWKGSVKARHFVLALHDFYIERQERTGPPRQGKEPTDDSWALAYLNVAHVQPILEAVDDDGTGFISISEVNNFATSRPEGWTLLQWIAYWAAGWHYSVWRYKTRIYMQVRRMIDLLQHILPVNQRIIDDYLSHWTFGEYEMLLRSATSFNQNERLDPHLMKLVDWFEKTEEERLRNNMKSVDYEIDSAETVVLVTGLGRIERYLFPLLYLLLERDLRIVMLGCNHSLGFTEFESNITALESLFIPVRDRMEHLAAVFKHGQADPGQRFGSFAFGMFQIPFSFLHELRLRLSDNSFLTWKNESLEVDENENLLEIARTIPVTELKVGVVDLSVFEDKKAESADKSPVAEDEPKPSEEAEEEDGLPLSGVGLLGSWSGHANVESGTECSSNQGLVDLTVVSIANGQVKGHGVTWGGRFTIEGTITKENRVNFVWKYDDYDIEINCDGSYDPNHDTMSGTWTMNSTEDDDDSDDGMSSKSGGNGERFAAVTKSDNGEGEEDGEKAEKSGEGNDDNGENEDSTDSTQSQEWKSTFLFTRTPHHLQMFRYNPSSFRENPARARWRFACNAVRYDNSRKSWSWKFLSEHVKIFQRFTFLTRRWLMDLQGMTPLRSLSEDEDSELTKIRTELDPHIAVVWKRFVDFDISRLRCYFNYFCDSCSRELYEVRIICLVCLSQGITDCMDICSNCIDKPCSRDDFEHNPSHTMLQFRQMTFSFVLASMIPESKARVPRVKGALQAAEKYVATEHDANSGGGGGKGKPMALADVQAHSWKSVRHIPCACCLKPVSTPCWVCAQCSTDIFICHDCEASRARPQDAGTEHRNDHTLLRIGTTEEDPELDTEDALLQARIDALEVKVEERLAAMEANVEARLSTIEDLLRQLLGQGQESVVKLATPVPP